MGLVGNDSSMSKYREGLQPVYLTIAEARGNQIDLLLVWRALVQERWVILGIVALFICGAVVYSVLATEKFKSEVLLVPAVDERSSGAIGRFGGLAALAGLGSGDSKSSAEALAILTSKKFLEDFIRDKNLLPVLFADQWDPAANKWKSASVEEHPDLVDGAVYFLEHVLMLSKDGETGFVTLEIEWRDPQVVAVWAMDLVLRLNEIKRQRDIALAQHKLDYLQQQLEQSSLLELRQAIADVIEEQIKAMMMAQAQHEYAFKIIDPAVAPKRRVWPQPVLIVVTAAMVGLMCALLVVFLRMLRARASGP